MIVLFGSNHRSAPISFRERLALDEAQLPAALERLRAHEGVTESLILSTCNRVEVLVSAAQAANGVRAIRSLLGNDRQIADEELDRYSYQLFDRDAVQHLFRVASGLDSMILGEPQILGQVKQAYLTAKRQKSTGPVLERLLQHCLATAKRVRSETGISRNAVSVAFAAVELGRRIFGDLDGRKALLVGAGKMASLVAKHLAANGVAELIVTSRSYNRAVAMAEEVNGRAVHWDDGLAQLAQVDILVSCTGATHIILTKKDVARAVRARRGEPLFLIDIAVPRDIDPAVDDLDNAYLYDIDGLQGVVDTNLEERRRAADEAQKLIEEEVRSFGQWQQGQAITPLIVALRESLYRIGDGELERLRRKLGPLSEPQAEAVRELTRGLIQKLLHRPIRHLRGSVERGDVEDCIGLYRELFGVSAVPPAPAEPDRPGESRGEQVGHSDPAAGPRRVLKGGRED